MKDNFYGKGTTRSTWKSTKIDPHLIPVSQNLQYFHVRTSVRYYDTSDFAMSSTLMIPPIQFSSNPLAGGGEA